MNHKLNSETSDVLDGKGLVLACVLIWLLASLISGFVGALPAIGAAAILLGSTIVWHDRQKAIALLKPRPKLVLLGFTTGFFMMAATYLLFPLFVMYLPFIKDDVAHLYALFREPPLMLVVLLLIPIVFCEEMVWRGAVQSYIVRKSGPYNGVLLASFVYALVHIPLGSPALVLVAFCCGLAWGTLCFKSKSLVPSLITHLSWNLFVMVIFPIDKYS